MSMWQLLSDDGNAFRWESSGNETHRRTSIDDPHERISNPPPLPSMEDLLFQGCTRIFGGGFQSGPIFKTGSGKPVALKQSSLERALSVLGCDDDDDDDGRSAGCPWNFGGGFESGRMFKTPVALKQSSLERALSVLGCDDDDGRSEGHFHCRYNGGSFYDSLFQTGSGKRVNISSAGLVRAKTLLGLDETDRLENGQKISTKDEPDNGQIISEPLGIESHADNSGVKAAFTSKTSLTQSHTKKETLRALKQFGTCDSSDLKSPPIKFNTAGGRSISVSRDALQRARSLLGEPEMGTLPCDKDVVTPLPSNLYEKRSNTLLKSKKLNLHPSQNGFTSGKSPSKGFVSPLRSLDISRSISSTNLIKKFDAECISEEGSCRSKCDVSDPPNTVEKGTHTTCKVRENSLTDCSGTGIDSLKRLSGGPLVDISNNIGTAQANRNHITGDKKRLGWNISVSPFKRPRNSRFSAPLSTKFSTVTMGPSCTIHEEPDGVQRISTRYPFRVSRAYVKEFFGLPKLCQETMHHLPEHLRKMTPEGAQKYIFFHGSDSDGIGIDAFCHLLTQLGASNQFASKEWVANHYKWIVWKLACYERCYSAQCTGKLLTISSVLEELKYRYEREVNHGHRSAIKRILEGDASPSSEVVLCVSAIHSEFDPSKGGCGAAPNGNENHAAKIEATDGWYSIDVLLDALLTKQLAARRLFIGQKLRILGAQLCGWAGPVSPLEVSRTASLVLHMNGTYRAHWADRLGFCKVAGPPLALRCIKSAGGPVPRTLVGVARIYPVLYRERLSNGGSIVRSERVENRVAQLHNQRSYVASFSMKYEKKELNNPIPPFLYALIVAGKYGRCSAIVEGIVSDFQRTGNMHAFNDSDSEEGAKIFRQLETAAEPEVLMAEMSSEQLASFTNYQAKLEAMRQLDMEKSIKKALKDGGLDEREVTPFMRVRVVGLTAKISHRKYHAGEALITIWDPTQKQQSELVEGKAYAVSGLTPLNSGSSTLHLQARGSTSKWQPLSPSEVDHFRPFFSPRRAVYLSTLGEVALSGEFDIAALVVFVGDVYTSSQQKRQWVFVTDGSIPKLKSEDLSSSLLAICFCSCSIDDDSFVPLSNNLVGSTVSFCNLVKQSRDEMNNLWNAEATENSNFFTDNDLPHSSHLKDAAASVQRWAKISGLVIKRLRETVLSIVHGSEGLE